MSLVSSEPFVNIETAENYCANIIGEATNPIKKFHDWWFCKFPLLNKYEKLRKNIILLVLWIIIYTVYMGVSPSSFSGDNVSAETGIYQAITVQTTTGYGDINPQTGLSKFVTFFHIMSLYMLSSQFYDDIMHLTLGGKKWYKELFKTTLFWHILIFVIFGFVYSSMSNEINIPEYDENRNMFSKGFWFAAVTHTTVGPGAYYPKTSKMRWISLTHQFLVFMLTTGVFDEIMQETGILKRKTHNF